MPGPALPADDLWPDPAAGSGAVDGTLPPAVLELDAAGGVIGCNPAAAALFAQPAEALLGRSFFDDVEPGTRMPAFYGRFLDGVRRGSLDEQFTFVLTRTPQPVRVAVRLRLEGGRVWLMLRPIATIAPSRQRAAAEANATVERRARAEPVDPSICESEPIHIPGAVQPYAVMLAADPASFVVEACSDNVADALPGRSPDSVIGTPLAELLPLDFASALRRAAEGVVLADPGRPLRRRLLLHGVGFATTTHLYDRRLVIELERLAGTPEDFGGTTPLDAQDAVSRLRVTTTLEAAAAVAAREIRAMTGFERVLVYRFDPDWNGEAVAEDKVADWEFSLAGLRFPASDIPAQARALYTRMPGRFVADRDAVSAGVVAEPQAANRAVDLTYAHSRALSPVHLEYQRNLGVNGSMSLSILVEGRLWGLVIGHHRQPHYVAPDTRALAGLVADAFALRVHELDSLRLWRQRQQALAGQNKLLESMAGSDDFVAALTAGDERPLLGIFEAAGAAVFEGERVATIGSTPPDAVLLRLAQWLRSELRFDRRVFATAQLSEHFADAADVRDTASGLLAVFVGEGDRDHLLMWFRPEIAATIVWGGDPKKPVLADSATRTVLPRRSFERWVEERRGQADPWSPWQAETALALAAAIEGVVLRQGRQIAELTAKQRELTRVLEQKEVLAREVDHRVKNSLQIVAGVMRVQARGTADPAAKAAFEDTYARVMSVARVHDSLQQSEDASTVDLGQTLRQLCRDLAAGITGAGQRLEVDTEEGLMVSSRAAVALALIATELVTNALKYAYGPQEAGRVEVRLVARPEGKVELRVCDNGKGLPEDWAEAQPRSATGGGLGMRLIRAMLQQVGAEMAVDGGSTGTCFTVLA